MIEVQSDAVRLSLWSGHMEELVGTGVTPESWHRLCIYWSGATGGVEVYVDGTLKQTSTEYDGAYTVSR